MTEAQRKYLMARGQKLNPRDWDIDMDREPFIDVIVGQFGEFSRGMLTVDELLYRPQFASRFCQDLRLSQRAAGWLDLPDDVILRTLTNARKEGK